MKSNKSEPLPKKLYVHSFGCKVNQYETQILSDNLKKDGYEAVSDLKNADALLVNSCTVTAEADRQCRQLIRKAMRKNPNIEIIVTGCYAMRKPDELAGISPRLKVIDKRTFLGAGSSISTFQGHSRAFVKIQDGCDAFCSYCIVPYVRNKMTSRTENDVLSEIKGLVANGYPEIVLTGIRLGKYQGGLERLLNKIIRINGNFRVRLSSLELWEVSEELILLMKENPQKICRHLHLPLQSGSDKILKEMRRPYTSGKFREVVKKIHDVLPDTGISTDVIVGFPGETDKDFNDTLNIARELCFSRLHVFKYSKRDGTLAASFKDTVTLETAKARAVILRRLDPELQAIFWKKFEGTVRQAVAEANNTFLTDNYIRLNSNIKSNTNMNKIVDVKIMPLGGKPTAVPTN